MLKCWKTVGVPDFLLLDSALNFRVSNRYPRSPGVVIRLCSYYGVQPVFIPISEPWRNGVIERFNDTYNRKFFHRQWFPSYATLKQQSKIFQQFHNRHHRYSCLNNKTPLETIKKENYKPITLGSNTKLSALDYVPDGKIILIRFIRSDRKLDIFGEIFEVSKNLVYSYVKAVIVTDIHQLQVFLDGDLVKTFDYPLCAQKVESTML